MSERNDDGQGLESGPWVTVETRPQRRGPAAGTIVWGSIVIVLAGLLGAGRLGWLNIEPGLAITAVLLVAGLGLVVGGIVSAVQGRRLAATHDASRRQRGEQPHPGEQTLSNDQNIPPRQNPYTSTTPQTSPNPQASPNPQTSEY